MYIRKTETEYHLQALYSNQWETETVELSRKEIKLRLREYQANAPGQYRIISKRVPKSRQSVIAIYDKPSTIDRYTIYFDTIGTTAPKTFVCLCCASNPASFCQHSHGQLGRHNGTRIPLSSLPQSIQEIVKQETAYYE